MTIPVGTHLRRATVIAVGLLFGVLIAVMAAAGARSIDASGPITSELTIAVADADWGLAPAARSSLGQHDTDPAPRRATGAVGVVGVMLISLAQGSTRASGPPTETAVRREASRRRSCRAPPLPQPL